MLSRQQLLDLARGEAHEAYDRSIDVQVSRLRRKLERDDDCEPLIRTLRNVGYLFSASVNKR
ncbi:Transcriptional regulatory protein OmpR [compost metagenome]